MSPRNKRRESRSLGARIGLCAEVLSPWAGSSDGVSRRRVGRASSDGPLPVPAVPMKGGPDRRCGANNRAAAGSAAQAGYDMVRYSALCQSGDGCRTPGAAPRATDETGGE